MFAVLVLIIYDLMKNITKYGVKKRQYMNPICGGSLFGMDIVVSLTWFI
jgi:hypothetical protein